MSLCDVRCAGVDRDRKVPSRQAVRSPLRSSMPNADWDLGIRIVSINVRLLLWLLLVLSS